MLPKKRKGQLGNLSTIAIAVVVAAVVIGFGAKILTDVGGTLSGSASQAVGNGTMALLQFAGYLPTIGVVVMGALIIGLLLRSFS